MRPAELPPGSLTAHLSRLLAPLCGYPLDAAYRFLLLVMRSMEPRRQACSAGRKAVSLGLGGTPTSAWEYRKRYSQALLAYAKNLRSI